MGRTKRQGRNYTADLAVLREEMDEGGHTYEETDEDDSASEEESSVIMVVVSNVLVCEACVLEYICIDLSPNHSG